MQFRGLAMTAIQDLTVQIEALKAAGCDVVRKEKASGTTTKGRNSFTLREEVLIYDAPESASTT
jgi:hypothetical protein